MLFSFSKSMNLNLNIHLYVFLILYCSSLFDLGFLIHFEFMLIMIESVLFNTFTYLVISIVIQTYLI